jgi:hypothetical protein
MIFLRSYLGRKKYEYITWLAGTLWMLPILNSGTVGEGIPITLGHQVGLAGQPWFCGFEDSNRVLSTIATPGLFQESMLMRGHGEWSRK